jgi:hypothetical protein
MSPGSQHTVLVVAVAVLAGLGALWLWGTGVRAGKKTEQRLRQVGRTGAVLGWGGLCSAVIVAVQWSLLTRTTDTGMWLLLLGLPGCIAGVSLARYCAVTLGSTGTYGRSGRGGRR